MSQFHLSIDVRSLDESVEFFTGVLKGVVSHKDPSGYVNIDLFGAQLTLKANPKMDSIFSDFHFGVNLEINEFDELVKNIEVSEYKNVVMLPSTTDKGTPLERKKMKLRCPTGYLIEIKGYRNL